MYSGGIFVELDNKKESELKMDINSMSGNNYPICVIIPAYNCKEYLTDAITSVKKQMCNANIVLIDDGSTDGTSELCEDLARLNSHIKVIHKTNGGVSSARNVGIDWVSKNMPQSWIAFLDADDAWDKSFYTEEVRKLLKKKYDLIGFQSCICNETMEFRNNPEQLANGEFHGGVKSVWIHATQSFGAMLYKCDFLKKYDIRFDEKTHYSED